MFFYLQNTSGSLCFRGQSIFLHNASGWFGSIPLEASGDFGIHPEKGEFHLVCQVLPYVCVIEFIIIYLLLVDSWVKGLVLYSALTLLVVL